jgi:hypothetical protein
MLPPLINDSPVEFTPHNRQCVLYTIISMAFIATHPGQGIINAAIKSTSDYLLPKLKKTPK